MQKQKNKKNNIFSLPVFRMLYEMIAIKMDLAPLLKKKGFPPPSFFCYGIPLNDSNLRCGKKYL